MELRDYEQLTAVLLEGQVAEPLEDHRHLLGVPVERKRSKRCVASSALSVLKPKFHCNTFTHTDDQET